jgi:hypothetical protein
LHNKETENGLELKKEVEERKLHRMAKVHHVLVIWQGSQNQFPTLKESRARTTQMTVTGFISDTEVIIKALWSYFEHDRVAAFKSSERSPSPPAVSAKDLPGG